MSNRRLKNNKAQVSDIMTWVVATIIIILILVVFIYASSLLAQKTKIIKIKEMKLEIPGEEINWLNSKTSFAYLKSSEEQRQIIDKWKEENKNE